MNSLPQSRKKKSDGISGRSKSKSIITKLNKEIARLKDVILNSNEYDEGYQEGYDAGYDKGYDTCRSNTDFENDEERIQ